MKFLIIIPAHNEEKSIASCLESLQNQSFQDFTIVVVNDGSRDKTREIVEHFQNQTSNIRLVNLEKSEHQPGAKVVRTFYKGLESMDWKAFDVICKFDADIVFPRNYLWEINRVFEENPKAGVVSGLVYIRNYKQNPQIKNLKLPSENLFDFSNKNHDWIFENLSSKNHVRGPIKAYRKDCFEDMNGLRPVLGWDNLDVLLAKKYGWEVVTIKDIWVKHLRPTAYQYKSQKAEKLGQYFYNIGLSLPLAMISSAKSSFKNRSAKEFFITMKSFLKQNKKRELSTEEIRFIRNLRWKEFFRNFGL
ncbi:glycosyltransferase family 2 protein [Chryseobacterium sp. SC28]|uniref:glycosyltransferase family 2 protein n=1 Tax=Chryseobacterium sp. SC28 TaxID=2268028 RepID=UPI000F654D77|nr:glycosyltransferase family 2 protein [Chryseobacterium sp. SC28]RRQ45482.1 glycosyltransferase family 2 protein [Chryseobacterium sp. SC28]